MSPVCPLCFSERRDVFSVANDKRYWRCQNCQLIYLSPLHHLDRAQEKARYELHENDPTDTGYQQFLRRLTDKLSPHLTVNTTGLDYGAGPSSAIPLILGEEGVETKTYDPLFPSDTDALVERYDFITCTETVEHFYQPWWEFYRFDRLLKPGGWLGIMTRMIERLDHVDAEFETWHYRRDETHVCFYSEATMHWIARWYGWSYSCPRDDVILFRKPRLLT